MNAGHDPIPPPVLAEDLRGLAETVPWDAATRWMLERAAEVCDHCPECGDPAAGCGCSERGCTREDCEDFRTAERILWCRLADLVADRVPPARPPSPSQVVTAVRDALAADRLTTAVRIVAELRDDRGPDPDPETDGA